jgi:amino acid transporter
MSGYPDDRFDDQRPLDPRAVEQARGKVAVPAVLLIVTGVIALIAVILAFVQLGQLPAQMDNAIAEVDADQNMPADQKDLMKKIYTMVKEHAESPVTPVLYAFNGACAVLVILGGVRLMKLSGPVLPIISSVLAMIPCTVGLCCLLGLPAGIWALVVINRPEVRATMAAKRSGTLPNPDDQYMR